MDLINKLASDNGLLGLLLALSLLGGIILFKMLINEKEKRLQDSKQSVDTIVTPLKNLQNSMDAIILLLKEPNKKR